MTAQNSGPDWGPFSLAVTGLIGAIAAAVGAVAALGKPTEKPALVLDGVAQLVDELQEERKHYREREERREARIEMLESAISARDQIIYDLRQGGNNE